MSHSPKTSHLCPVCGYRGLYRPAYLGPEGNHYMDQAASHEICPSCGFQFGYTDQGLDITHEQWRAKWIAEGMPWDGIDIRPPSNWDPVEQLKRVTGKD